MKRSEEVVSAIFFTKDKFLVTSLHAIKSIEKMGVCDNKKIAIAYNFSDEAILLFKQNGYSLVQYSNFPWTDECWENSTS